MLWNDICNMFYTKKNMNHILNKAVTVNIKMCVHVLVAGSLRMINMCGMQKSEELCEYLSDHLRFSS